MDTLVANQPYVDPGYAQLNPGYDQPANVRPVWGLAKPLPHVLRSGMVPSNEELREMQQRKDELHQVEFSEDIESGRIDPTLRPHRILPVLDNIRRDRELRLSEDDRQRYKGSPPFSPPLSPPPRKRKSSIEDVGHPSRVGEKIIEEDEEQPHEQLTSQQQPSELDLPQLREAIASVNRAREEENLEIAYQDAVPLSAYEAEAREKHNLHTWWSVVRLRFRDEFAELLGVSEKLGVMCLSGPC